MANYMHKVSKQNLIQLNIMGWGLLCLVGLGLLSCVSLYVGAKSIPFETIGKGLFYYQASNPSEVIVHTLRWPRLLAAIICGVSFSVSGALMQGLTNNPMASPSILGINSGAAFGLVVAMILYPMAALPLLIIASFLGAALAVSLIFFLSSRVRQNATPVFLALAGTAVSAVFVALTQILALIFDVAQDLSYWTAGGISGVRLEQIEVIAPLSFCACLLALYLSKSITLLSFGQEVAVGLGSHLKRVRWISGFTVLLLSGTAVALAGPIGFVGLVVPHITRQLVGVDYRKVIPFCALLGSLLVIGADIVSRLVNPPYETPLGAITALLGVPFFIWLANRKGGRD
ncbi:MAG: iron ABC transporter permease [Veillonellaceae bacterium]|nr:iron ABC transporter permease [Veillonellaceae bacterium]